ncbi:MAG: hypothetical protein RLZZ361_984 [Cyanobacteriota bacterium]|jgi:hypothetical protein
METKDIQFINEASANGYDGELYLLKGFQDQLLEILVKFSPSNFTNDNGIVPHRFTFAIIDSDYAVYGINCLSAINKANGIKVKVNVN